MAAKAKKASKTLGDMSDEMQDIGHVGSNIRAYIIGNHLYLEIDLNQSAGITDKGNVSIARSGMFAPLGGTGMLLNLNLTKVVKKDRSVVSASSNDERKRAMANLMASFG